VSLLRGVYRFLYDFIVGDDWKVAAGVVLSLVVGLMLLRAGLPSSGVIVTTAAFVVALFVVALVLDVRRRDD